MHRLPLARNRGADLRHPGILGAQIGVDGGEYPDLFRERHFLDRVGRAVKRAIRLPRRQVERAAAAGGDGAHRRRRARERISAEVAGVGIGRGFARNRPQTEPLRNIVACGLQLAVVEGQRLARTVFQEQFAVVRPGERVRDRLCRCGQFQAGTLEKKIVGCGKMAHESELLRRGNRVGQSYVSAV